MSSTGFGIVAGSSVTGYDLCVGSLGDGVCDTLSALGASDNQLGAVGTDGDPASAASILLTQLTASGGGQTQYGVPASNIPTSSLTDTILGVPGSAINATASAANSAATAVGGFFGNIGSWFSSNWLWIVAAIVGVILLIVFVYGAGRNL